jgi:hypothetical protein
LGEVQTFSIPVQKVLGRLFIARNFLNTRRLQGRMAEGWLENKRWQVGRRLQLCE